MILRVGELATHKGLTVRMLAAQDGLPVTTVLRWWYGPITRVKLSVLERLCRALETTPGELLVLAPREDDQS